MSEIDRLAKDRELLELDIILKEILDEDWQARIRAINKLVSFKKSDEFFLLTIPMLIEATRDSSELVRLAAIPALGDLGPRARISTERLIEILSTGGYEEVKASVHSLGKIGDDQDKVIISLLKLYDNDYQKSLSDELSKSISWALGILGPKALPHFRREINKESINSKIGILQAIGIMGPPAISLLDECIKLLSSNEIAIRSEAAKAIGNLRASTEIVNAIPELANGLNDPDPDVRWLMSEALRKIGTDEALTAWASYTPINSISALSKQLRNSDKAVRENAAEKLFPLLTKGCNLEIEDFRYALKLTSHSRMLVLLIEAMSNLGEDSLIFISELENLLLNESKEVRGMVCSLLSKLEKLPDSLVPGLVKLLTDNDKDVRLKSAIALELSDTDTAKKALKSFNWA